MTLLQDGRVMMVTCSYAIFDPVSGAVTATTAPSVPANSTPEFAPLTTLSNGTVLELNSYCAPPISDATCTTREDLYDPSSATWTAGASLQPITILDTQFVLSNGEVLVSGWSAVSERNVLIFNPTAASWKLIGVLPNNSYMFTPVEMPNGSFAAVVQEDRVIPDRIAEYNSKSGSLVSGPRLPAFVGGPSYTLGDGTVYVSGRYAGILDPGTGALTSGGLGFWDAAGVLLPDGRVLLAGGFTELDQNSPISDITTFQKVPAEYSLSAETIEPVPPLAPFSFSIKATPANGSSAGAVQLGCGPAPASECSVSPASVAIGQTTEASDSGLNPNDVLPLAISGSSADGYSTWTMADVGIAQATLTASSPSVTVEAGSSASLQIGLTENSTYSVHDLACQTLPPGWQCSFGSNELTGPTDSTSLTIKTSSNSGVPGDPTPLLPNAPWPALMDGAAFAALMAALLAVVQRKRMATKWALGFLLGCAVAAAGCSGPAAQPSYTAVQPVLNTTITVTGTFGTLPVATRFQVVVTH
jgi:hypothetical protein